MGNGIDDAETGGRPVATSWTATLTVSVPTSDGAVYSSHTTFAPAETVTVTVGDINLPYPALNVALKLLPIGEAYASAQNWYVLLKSAPLSVGTWWTVSEVARVVRGAVVGGTVVGGAVVGGTVVAGGLEQVAEADAEAAD